MGVICREKYTVKTTMYPTITITLRQGMLMPVFSSIRADSTRLHVILLLKEGIRIRLDTPHKRGHLSAEYFNPPSSKDRGCRRFVNWSLPSQNPDRQPFAPLQSPFQPTV
jgi:hypothetical protein